MSDNSKPKTWLELSEDPESLNQKQAQRKIEDSVCYYKTFELMGKDALQIINDTNNDIHLKFLRRKSLLK